MKRVFASTGEPEVVDRGAGALASFQRPSDFSAIRNRASMDFAARLTPTFGVAVGYQNNYYDYYNTGAGSLSALLDRTEQLFHLDGQWFPTEHTKLFVGYQFGMTDYTSNDPLGFTILTDVTSTNVPVITLVPVSPDRRNNRSHYLYTG